MSELTTCNFCTLEAIKKQFPGRRVEVRKAGEHTICDLQVYVDGRPLEIWFDAISDHCVC